MYNVEAPLGISYGSHDVYLCLWKQFFLLIGSLGSYCGFGGGGGGGGGRESFSSRASSEVSSIIKVKEEAMDDSNTDDIMKDLLHDNVSDLMVY